MSARYGGWHQPKRKGSPPSQARSHASVCSCLPPAAGHVLPRLRSKAGTTIYPATRGPRMCRSRTPQVDIQPSRAQPMPCVLVFELRAACLVSRIGLCNPSPPFSAPEACSLITPLLANALHALHGSHWIQVHFPLDPSASPTGSKCIPHCIQVHLTASRCISHCIQLHLSLHPSASLTASKCISHCIQVHLSLHPTASLTASNCIAHCTQLHLSLHPTASLTASNCISHRIQVRP